MHIINRLRDKILNGGQGTKKIVVVNDLPDRIILFLPMKIAILH
jgi:hypothetical protein